MINVITKLLPVKKNDLKSVVPHMKNQAAGMIAKKIKYTLGNVRCENHPTEVSVITVTPVNGNSQSFDLKVTKCCCEDFKSSIKLKIR